jgi:hypothetical protein
MEEAIARNRALAKHLRSLNLHVLPPVLSIQSKTSKRNKRKSKKEEEQKPAQPPNKEQLVAFVGNFRNLENLTINGTIEMINSLLPAVNFFAAGTRLEHLRLDSRPFDSRYYYFEGSEERYVKPFDHSVLGRFPLQRDSEVVVIDIRKLSSRSSSPKFSVQLYGEQSINPRFVEIIKSFEISKLGIVNRGSNPDLETLLQAVKTPSLLSSLSLFAVDNTQDFEPILAAFINLSELSLGSKACLDGDVFYELLSTLPLTKLHLGAGNGSVNAQDILSLVKPGGSAHIPSLKLHVLDNINARIPDPRSEWMYEGGRGLSDWQLPKWNWWCKKEEVEELRRIAKQSGVETKGTTFFGLDIMKRKEYRSAKNVEERIEADSRRDRWDWRKASISYGLPNEEREARGLKRFDEVEHGGCGYSNDRW